MESPGQALASSVLGWAGRVGWAQGICSHISREGKPGGVREGQEPHVQGLWGWGETLRSTCFWEDAGRAQLLQEGGPAQGPTVPCFEQSKLKF